MRGQGEVATQTFHELENLFGIEEIGCAASEVHLLHLAVAVEPVRQQLGLACQPQ